MKSSMPIQRSARPAHVAAEDKIYRSSPRLRQRRFAESLKTVRPKQARFAPTQTVNDIERQCKKAIMNRTSSPKLTDSSKVQVVGDEDANSDYEKPPPSAQRPSAKRKRKGPKVTEPQKTLTQIEFLDRVGSEVPSTAESRKRKRSSGLRKERAQTTITQMPLVRIYNPRDEAEDHLGYGELLSEKPKEEEIARDVRFGSSDRRGVRHTEPIPDSEDDDGTDTHSTRSVLVDVTNVMRETGSQGRRMRSTSPVPVDKLGSDPPLPLSPHRDSSPRTTYVNDLEQSMQTPQRSAKRRPLEIPSSQSPVLSPLTSQSRRTRRTPQSSPAHSPSLRRTILDPRYSPHAASRLSHPNGDRSPKRRTTAQDTVEKMSPTKRRIMQFRAQLAEARGKFGGDGTKPNDRHTRPAFISSSTKTSTWSTGSNEENDVPGITETQFAIGDDTQAELSGLLPDVAESLEETAVNPHKGKRTAAATKAKSLNGSDTERGVDDQPPIVAGVPSSPALQPDLTSQEQASAQLLSETHEYSKHRRLEDGSTDGIARLSQPAAAPTQVRSSQATTVGTSPGHRSQYQNSLLQERSQLAPVLVPSSPSRTTPQQAAQSPAVLETQVVSFQTSTTGVDVRSSQSLVRPSSISLDSSPLLPSAHWRKTCAYPSDDDFIAGTQLLPESLLDDNIPPPPRWTDD